MVSAILIRRNGRAWSWPAPIPVPEGRRGGSHGLFSYDIEEVEKFSHGYPHPSSGRRGESTIGKAAMVSALLALSGARARPWPSPSPFQKE